MLHMRKLRICEGRDDMHSDMGQAMNGVYRITVRHQHADRVYLVIGQDSREAIRHLLDRLGCDPSYYGNVVRVVLYPNNRTCVLPLVFNEDDTPEGVELIVWPKIAARHMRRKLEDAEVKA